MLGFRKNAPIDRKSRVKSEYQSLVDLAESGVSSGDNVSVVSRQLDINPNMTKALFMAPKYEATAIPFSVRFQGFSLGNARVNTAVTTQKTASDRTGLYFGFASQKPESQSGQMPRCCRTASSRLSHPVRIGSAVGRPVFSAIARRHASAASGVIPAV